MNEERNRIIFSAKCITPGRSIADNQQVKEWELNTIAEGISREAARVPLSEGQQQRLQNLLAFIDELKQLSGKDFRTRCLGLGGNVELFLQQLPEGPHD